jgi:hypothetical protein
MEAFGFIITRHVNNDISNQYWIECYKCIRAFYDAKIIIIDDNSKKEFITEYTTINCQVIESEFPGCGELLPYYYLYKNKWFKQAIVLHDSCFIKARLFPVVDLNTVKFIWHFEHFCDDPNEEKKYINKLSNPSDLINTYDNKGKWKGCFGVMSAIDLDFLISMQDKYKLFNLVPIVNCRRMRMYMERVFATVCHRHDPNLINNPSLCGIIHHHYKSFSYSFQDYLQFNQIKSPIIKVWSGR